MQKPGKAKNIFELRIFVNLYTFCYMQKNRSKLELTDNASN